MRDIDYMVMMLVSYCMLHLLPVPPDATTSRIMWSFSIK
jgi:hypothetical protein